MNVVLTGGTGFLGSRLVRTLLDRDCGVTLLTRRNTDFRRIADLIPRLTVHTLDVDRFESVFASPRRVDAVVHAATDYGRTANANAAVFEANVALPVRLLEAARMADVPTFLNVGTSLPPGLNAYSLSKSLFAEWGQATCAEGNTRFIHAVVEHFFGPGDDDDKFIAYVIAACLGNASEIALTSGEQRRDFVHVDDVAQALLLLLVKSPCMPQGCHRFEIGSGNAVAVRHVAETIRNLTGSHTSLEFGSLPPRPQEPMFSQADISAMTALGWTPRIGLLDGLRTTIDQSRGRK